MWGVEITKSSRILWYFRIEHTLPEAENAAYGTTHIFSLCVSMTFPEICSLRSIMLQRQIHKLCVTIGEGCAKSSNFGVWFFSFTFHLSLLSVQTSLCHLRYGDGCFTVWIVSGCIEDLLEVNFCTYSRECVFSDKFLHGLVSHHTAVFTFRRQIFP